MDPYPLPIHLTRTPTTARVGRLRVSAQVLAEMFRRDDRRRPDLLVWIDGMPVGARIVVAEWNALTDCVEFLVDAAGVEAGGAIDLTCGYQRVTSRVL